MKPQSEKGFTLAEVMISAAILGVGVMGMAAMQGVSFSKNVDANDLSIVTNVAADMMERIQSNRRFAWAYNNIDTTGTRELFSGWNSSSRPTYAVLLRFAISSSNKRHTG